MSQLVRDEVPQPSTADAEVPDIFEISDVTVGYNHACVIDQDGALYCWGANALGQLGLGDQDARTVPTRVGEADDWLTVSAGRFHSCGLREGGVLQCWGGGAFGQVGQIQDAVLTPTTVAAPSGAWTSVSAGQWHTCALNDDGEAYCWGYNLLGRLGDGSGAGTEQDPEASIETPTLVVLPVTLVAISCGASHTCAIDDDGALWCWGSGEDDRLGVAAADECTLGDSTVPCALDATPLADGRAYATISAGGAHTCATQSDGALWCWGQGAYGQLGVGELDPPMASTPARVTGDYAAVASGASHTCVLDANGAALCFGDGANGQLGRDLAAADEPEAVDLGQDAVRIASGALGSCAITASNGGFCWGFSAYAGSSTPQAIVSVSL